MRIKGKVAYAYTNTPDTQFNPHAWKVSVVVDKDTKNQISEATGLKFTRTDGDFWEALGDYKLNVKRNTEGKGKRLGVPNLPPQVALNGVPQDGLMIGTGSLAEVEFTTYNWEFDGRKGCSADFKGINVLELVEVAPRESSSEEEEETPAPEEDTGEIAW